MSAGNSVIVGCAVAVFTSTEPVFTFDDGNIYTEDVAVWFSTAPGQRAKVVLHRYHNATAGAKTITGAFTGPSAANVYGAMRAYEVSGLANAAPDKTMSGTGTSTAPATSASGTLTQTDNFVIGAMLSQFAGIDLPSGFTNLYLDDTTAGAPPSSHDYRIVASTSSVTISWGTLDVSGDWAAVGAVYKDAAVGGQPAGSRGRGVPGMRLGGQRFGRGW